MSNESVLEQCVSSACISLFADYALPLERADAGQLRDAPPLLYCGVIGFSGEQLRGSLLLATSREPLGRTSPTTDASLREWIAELSNQLLGRVKNKLYAHGVTLYLSTPVVLRGEHIAPLSQTPLTPFGFRCDGGQVCVWLDTEIGPNIDLTRVVDTAGVLGEGDSALF
jgi:hypothetical protein